MYKSYLVFSHLDRHEVYPNKSIKREKQIRNKKINSVFMIYSDGLIIDYNPSGMHIGYQDYNTADPNWIPGVFLDDELRYSVLRGKSFSQSERDTLLNDLSRFRDYTGELETDVVNQVKGEIVEELVKLKRLTHSTLIAYIYGKDDYYSWDADRVYTEIGEHPLPGTYTEFKLEVP